jgi:hypothetical protein
MKNEPAYFWPQWFLSGLNQTENKKIKAARINNALLTKLNRGQFYLWRALNIYDDFLDGDGERQKLPQANSYLRRFLEIYYRLNLPADFYYLFNKIMADLEAANRAEVLESRLKIKNGRVIIPGRLPRFKNLAGLARKSLALALGPLALLALLGCRANSKKMRAALNFWRYALAAKQLSDDARDWFEDLRVGAITAANVLVLEVAQKRRLILDLDKKPEIVYGLFALATAEISGQIKNLCARAKKSACEADLNTNGRLLREIIGPLEKATEEADEFRKLLGKS